MDPLFCTRISETDLGRREHRVDPACTHKTYTYIQDGIGPTALQNLTANHICRLTDLFPISASTVLHLICLYLARFCHRPKDRIPAEAPGGEHPSHAHDRHARSCFLISWSIDLHRIVERGCTVHHGAEQSVDGERVYADCEWRPPQRAAVQTALRASDLLCGILRSYSLLATGLAA